MDRRRPRREPQRDRRRGAAGYRQRRLHRARSTTSPNSPRWNGNCRCRRGWSTSATSSTALADVCHEPARADEPYRRALRVIHGRLTATACDILDRQPEHELDLGLPRYQTPEELLADLDMVDASLRANGSALLADDRLARLREAVRVFGFHLSGLDMRQNSDVHEEVVAELLAWAGVHPDYRSLPEPERVELLVAELATRRPAGRARAPSSPNWRARNSTSCSRRPAR